jgi:hypothetical protein
MSESTIGQPGRPGKRKQAWTERAARRAARACPDRIVRILRNGVIELVPMAAEAPETAADNADDGKSDWENI